MDKEITVSLSEIESRCERYLKSTSHQEQSTLTDINSGVYMYLKNEGCLWDLQHSKPVKKVIANTRSKLNELERYLHA